MDDQTRKEMQKRFKEVSVNMDGNLIEDMRNKRKVLENKENMCQSKFDAPEREQEDSSFVNNVFVKPSPFFRVKQDVIK